MCIHRSPPRAPAGRRRPFGALALVPGLGPGRADGAGRAAAFRRAVAVALLLSVCAGGLRAEQVSIRSGAHPGFSRLVLPFTRPVGWRLSPVAGGYSLSLSRGDVTFDLAGVFRRIPGSRLAAITRSGPGRLDLDLACKCGAEAFWLDDPYRLVIDLRDDGDRAGIQQGGFWPAVGEGGTAAPAAASTPPAAGPVAEADTPAPEPRRAPAAAAPRPAPDRARKPPAMLLPVATRLVPLPSGGAGPGDPGPAVLHAGDKPDSAGKVPPERRVSRPAPAAAPDRDRRSAAGKAAVPAQPPAPASPAGAITAAPRAAGGVTAGPDARGAMAALRDDLARAVARAAAQGLLSPEMVLPSPADATGAEAPDPPPGDAGPAPPIPEFDRSRRAGAGPSAHTDTAAAPAPGMRVETSVDSALAEARRPRDTGVPPQQCRDRRGYDIPSWQLSGTPAALIGAARADLLDATGAPRPEGLRRLVETYLYLGFGAEARAALDSLGETPDASAYRDLAAIMDPQVAGPSSRLAGQLGCDGPVALWAALARGNLARAGTLNLDAIVAAFAALPAHLRRRFGPDLAASLEAIGASAKAAIIANATRRAVPAAASVGTVALMEARAALSAGARAEAFARLGGLVAQGGDAAPEATALLIEARLAAGEAPAPATVEAAHAFAREHRDRPIGVRLARAAILGDAALGRFDAAFRGLDALAGAARRNVAGPLFARLAADAAADGLLRHLVPRLDEGRLPALGPGPSLALAARLIDLGFPDRAEALLAAASPAPEETAAAGLRARLALARGAPEAALARLAGLDDPAAQALRAEAAEAAGDLDTALRAALAAGAKDRAARLAWRMGAWREVARLAAPPRRTLAESRLATRPAPAAPAGKTPRLASARALIETSRARRALVKRLLDAPGPAVATHR